MPCRCIIDTKPVICCIYKTLPVFWFRRERIGPGFFKSGKCAEMCKCHNYNVVVVLVEVLVDVLDDVDVLVVLVLVEVLVVVVVLVEVDTKRIPIQLFPV